MNRIQSLKLGVTYLLDAVPDAVKLLVKNFRWGVERGRRSARTDSRPCRYFALSPQTSPLAEGKVPTGSSKHRLTVGKEFDMEYPCDPVNAYRPVKYGEISPGTAQGAAGNLFNNLSSLKEGKMGLL